jgi:uncharacterized protein
VIEDLPLGTLLRFFANHGLLGVTTHHPWRTVVGGTSSYIAPLTAPYADRIHPATGRRGAPRPRRRRPGSRRRDATASTRSSSPTHADEALGLLADPTRGEGAARAWEYSDNDTWLHTDTALLPRSRRAWASWNYLLDDCRTPSEQVSLSYHMNRLQTLDEPREYVVTLNPSTPAGPATVLRRLTYTHPATPPRASPPRPARRAQRPRRTFYAGAYQRYGFHEDGLWSAVRAVSHLGVRWPT